MTDDTTDIPSSAEDAESLDREAAAAAELAVELERRYINGDESVDPEQIAEQEKLGRWAKLKAERARRAAEKAKIAARLDAANALRVEIEQYEKGIGSKLSSKLRAVQDAEAAFLALGDEHDEKVRAWKKRAQDLGIPASDGRPLPPAKDGRLALGQNESVVLQVGRRQVALAAAKSILERFHGHSQDTHVPTAEARAGILARVERIDPEIVEPTGPLYFYRGAGGGVIVMDHPLPDEQIKRDRIKVLSRAEAWGE